MTIVRIGSFPVDPLENDHVGFFAVVKNIGTAPTPQGTALGVSFSIDKPNDRNVVTWSDNHRDALAPGATTTLTANSGPSGLSYWNAVKGGHTLWAWVDNINRFPELNEGNNQTSLAFSVAVRQADLVITSVSVAPLFGPAYSGLCGSNSCVLVGNEITASATVKNIGTDPTPPNTVIGVAFYLTRCGGSESPFITYPDCDSRNGIIDQAHLVSWSDLDSSSLAPGASRTFTANNGPLGKATWSQTGGKYGFGETDIVTGWVNNTNRFSETNVNNNRTGLIFDSRTIF